MEDGRIEETDLGKFKTVQRRTVKISQETLVKTDYLDDQKKFPLVVQPTIESVNLAAWAMNNLELINRQLCDHGGILFRGFNVESVSQFEQFARAISPDLLDYRERAAPRKEVSEK